jgi:2-keto-4-pentenoate hydratase
MGGGVSHAHDNSSGSPIARAFTDARRTGRAVPSYPGAQPDSMDAAYAVQDEAIALWPDRIAGWKLGRINAPWDARFGAGRLAGPIFSKNVWAAESDKPTPFGVIEGGFAAVEAEYVLELGDTAVDRGDWTAETAAALVGRVFTGVEIAGSPFPGINDYGPAVTASDFGNNAGLILGAEVRDWRARLSGLTCSVTIDGEIIGTGGAASIPNGPLDSLAFLLSLLHHRGRRLEAGQLISTGAATGVHQIFAGQSSVADFGPDGRIACVAIAASGASA